MWRAPAQRRLFRTVTLSTANRVHVKIRRALQIGPGLGAYVVRLRIINRRDHSDIDRCIVSIAGHLTNLRVLELQDLSITLSTHGAAALSAIVRSFPTLVELRCDGARFRTPQDFAAILAAHASIRTVDLSATAFVRRMQVGTRTRWDALLAGTRGATFRLHTLRLLVTSHSEPLVQWMEAHHGRWEVHALVVGAVAKHFPTMARLLGVVGPCLESLTIEMLDESSFIGEYC